MRPGDAAGELGALRRSSKRTRSPICPKLSMSQTGTMNWRVRPKTGRFQSRACREAREESGASPGRVSEAASRLHDPEHLCHAPQRVERRAGARRGRAVRRRGRRRVARASLGEGGGVLLQRRRDEPLVERRHPRLFTETVHGYCSRLRA